MNRAAPTSSASPALAARGQARDWFLRGSCWDDAHWVLAPTSAAQETRPVIIRWDFPLHKGQSFTDRR